MKGLALGGLAACLFSLVALMVLVDNGHAPSELVAAKGLGGGMVHQAAVLGSLVHEQASLAEGLLQQKIEQLKIMKGTAVPASKSQKKVVVKPESTTHKLATPSGYSQETRDLYNQAREYEDQAREMYYKSEETYWQANSQATYDDWHRGQQEWDYWYNRPDSRTSPAPLPGVSYGYYKADQSFVQLYEQRLQLDHVQSGPENVARTQYLMAELLYRENVPGATHHSWEEAKARWEADRRVGRGGGGAAAPVLAGTEQRAGEGEESRMEREGRLREQAQELYLEALQSFMLSSASAEGYAWADAMRRWDQRVLDSDTAAQQAVSAKTEPNMAALAAGKSQDGKKGAAEEGKAKQEEASKEEEEKLGFVERVRGGMAKDGVYSPQEAVARAQYLAAHAAFIRGEGDRPGRSWVDAREGWGEFLLQEKQLDAAQAAINAQRARVLQRYADEGAAAEQAQGAGERGSRMRGREQQLYLTTDETPSQPMLSHYWRSFTARPPSRLPAFGMASTAGQLERHVRDAARAARRLCLSPADCRRVRATLRALQPPAEKRAQSAREEAHAGKGAAAEAEAVEAGVRRRARRSAAMAAEAAAAAAREQALESSRPALPALPTLSPAPRHPASAPPAPAAHPPRSSSRQALHAAAAASSSSSSSSSSPAEEEDAAAAAAARAHAQQSAAARARAAAAGAAAPGWARVAGYVRPWDAASLCAAAHQPQRAAAGAAGYAGAFVREHGALCRVLAIVHRAHSAAAPHAATAPAFRAEEAAEEAAEEPQQQQQLAAPALSAALAEVNAEQAHLNHLRLKLYIREFGAPFRGETPDGDEHSPEPPLADTVAASAHGPKGIVDGVMSLLGFAPKVKRAQTWDQKLAGLLKHLKTRKEDWRAVTRAWDAVGAGVDGLIELPPAHAAAHPAMDQSVVQVGARESEMPGEKEIWTGLDGEERRLVGAEKRILEAKRAMLGVGRMFPRLG